MVETIERIIALEGAVNFRDLGGYEAGGGRRTRCRRTLFRADGLGELTRTDLSVLSALGIRTVIDLRSGSELDAGASTSRPTRWPSTTSRSSPSCPTRRH